MKSEVKFYYLGIAFYKVWNALPLGNYSNFLLGPLVPAAHLFSLFIKCIYVEP